MKTEKKQAIKAEKVDSDEQQLNEYYVRRFVSSLKKERRDKSLLESELDAITEGKNIILSNAHSQ